MKVSVLLATYRTGGIDVAFHGLGRQNFPADQWELILCDVHYDKRRDAVAEYAKQFPGLPLVHVPAFRTQNPLDSSEKDRNSAIAYAEGELCVFLCDYAYVRPDFVERHWLTYEAHGKKAGVMAPHHYVAHPAIRSTWDTEPITVFEEAFTPERLPQMPHWSGGQDPKLGMSAGPIDYTFCHLKNESLPTEVLMQLNGCDEMYNYDGGHLMGDTDMALRATKVGCSFVLDPLNVAEIVQVRDFYPILQRHRGIGDDVAYFNSRKDGPVEPPVRPGFNDFNMRELREKMIWEKNKLR